MIEIKVFDINNCYVLVVTKMKRGLIVFFVILALTLSCSRNDSNIDYYDISPDLMYFAADSFKGANSPECPDIPIPYQGGSIETVSFQKGQIPGFMLYIGYFCQFDMIGECDTFATYFIRVQSLPGLEFKRSDEVFYVEPIIKHYNLGEEIIDDDKWTSEKVMLYYMMKSPEYDENNIIFNDTFIGFKYDKRIGWVHIEMIDNVKIAITEYAINLEENHSIIAGKKE
jgi:hypothetical protein